MKKATSEIRICLDCGQALQGRRDKKFCDQACRVNYHNNRLQQSHRTFRKINSILVKNRMILLNNFLEGREKLSRPELARQGYNFEFLTSIFKQGNKEIYICYDIGFMEITRNDLKIRKIEDVH